MMPRNTEQLLKDADKLVDALAIHCIGYTDERASETLDLIAELSAKLREGEANAEGLAKTVNMLVDENSKLRYEKYAREEAHPTQEAINTIRGK